VILSQTAMQTLEADVIASGVSASALMDEVADGMASALLEQFGTHRFAVIFAGKGHNAGDAFATATRLRRFGWKFIVRTTHAPRDFAALTTHHAANLGAPIANTPVQIDQHIRAGASPLPPILIDGLVGLGAKGPLRGETAIAAKEMNRLRATTGARTAAMDIPSGLNPDDGTPSEECVIADTTLTVGFCKHGLVADAAVNHVGRLVVVPCAAFNARSAEIFSTDGDALVTSQIAREWLPRRRHAAHKGTSGRLTVLAGSPGMHGAAALCATAAVRGGAGLVTLYCHRAVYELVSAQCPPEVMVRGVDHFAEGLDLRADALAIGPGIGS
jgi:NAD(P)H-hydrate epimerase